MQPKQRQALKVLAWLLFVGYSVCLVYWMFRGFGRAAHIGLQFNLVPLNTIFGYIFNLNTDNLGTTIINLAGNIGVFMPFGVLLPFLFPGLRRYSLFLTWFTASVIVLEFLQTILRVGIGDIDDVILNGIGASLGFMVYRLCSQKI
ncbi:VanZ family protein [Paenibacillus chibensis]|uniref:VanZ family protein n=1 Tax=Paenibacillus chibensis TaxID=59846 RepID=UPI000FD78B15|nr:VanZ family protein [Paenibacillus chibensis]MEC0370593.1 VanZ family protein [Paenibacillus chibensis]